LGAVVAAMLGAFVVLAIFGPGIVPPDATGWMLSGRLGPDPVQYWLGWSFFRDAPWSLPPGLSPGFGMELSSSVFYADAIPLLALVFKALRGVVEVGQYWGLWLVACGALQGWLAWRLIGLCTASPLARLAGAMLFVLQPMLLNRMAGHFALAAHFLLLWGLWFALSGAGRWRWTALTLAASLIHSYLLPMVLALWAADWWRRRAVPEAVMVPAAGLLGLWAAGFFVLGAGHGGSLYGAMQLDLLAPFDPAYWGRFLPDLPDPDHPEVAGSYLGLGALLLLPFLAWLRPGRRHLPLILVLLAMLAFAITHRPSIGGVQVTLLALPDPLVEFLGMLRASERFFWPIAYLAILAGIAGLLRALGARAGALALVALLLVQAADLRPGIARLAGFFPATAAQLPPRLADPFWVAAARCYTAIRAVPAANRGSAWEEIAVFAARHGMATDAIYLARSDAAAVAALQREIAARLAEGRPEPGVLYVLRDAKSLALAEAGLRPGRDSIIEADGLQVLAPDWRVTNPGFLTKRETSPPLGAAKAPGDLPC
jgi:hypothetical protein